MAQFGLPICGSVFWCKASFFLPDTNCAGTSGEPLVQQYRPLVWCSWRCLCVFLSSPCCRKAFDLQEIQQLATYELISHLRFAMHRPDHSMPVYTVYWVYCTDFANFQLMEFEHATCKQRSWRQHEVPRILGGPKLETAVTPPSLGGKPKRFHTSPTNQRDQRDQRVPEPRNGGTGWHRHLQVNGLSWSVHPNAAIPAMAGFMFHTLLRYWVAFKHSIFWF